MIKQEILNLLLLVLFFLIDNWRWMVLFIIIFVCTFGAAIYEDYKWFFMMIPFVYIGNWVHSSYSYNTVTFWGAMVCLLVTYCAFSLFIMINAAEYTNLQRFYTVMGKLSDMEFKINNLEQKIEHVQEVVNDIRWPD